jgi:hypothetical protein
MKPERAVERRTNEILRMTGKYRKIHRIYTERRLGQVAEIKSLLQAWL